MKKDKDTSADAVELRRRAMERLKAQGTDEESMRTEKYALRMLHELQVHQIELEMQNETLQQSQAESEASLRLYTDLYDFAPVGYFTLDRACAIRQVNLIGAQLVEAECSRLIGAHFGFFVSPETRPIFNDFLQSVFDNHSVKSCEVVIQTKTSSQFYARIEASISSNGEECRIAVINLNLEKQLEALEKSEERFCTLANLSPVGIYLCDTEGRCQYANPCWCEMAGMSQEEALGEGWIKGLHPEDRASALSAWQQMAESEGRWGLEYRFRTPAGKVTWVRGLAAPQRNAKGKIVGYVGINIDITKRKREENILRHNQAMLARTESIAHIGSWEWDVATDTVTWSDELFRMFQRDPADGAPSFAEHSDYYHPEDLARLQHAVDITISDGTPYEMELRGIRADGETRVCLARGYPEIDSDGGVVRLVGSLQDITERKLEEEQLADSEHRFRMLFEQAPLGIALIDSLNGQIYAVNPKFAEIAGRTMEQMTTIDWMSITHPDDVQADLDQMALLNAGQIPGFQMEKRYLRPDGSIVWINMTISSMLRKDVATPRHFCMIDDITERKLTEETLRESEERFFSAFEYAAIGKALVSPEGQWIRVNKSLCEIVGFSKQELMTKTFQDITHPDDLDSDPEYVRQMLAGDILTYQMEKRYIHKQGHTVWTLLSVSLVRDSLGKPLYFISQIQDITGRKQAEDMLARLAEREHHISEVLQQAVMPSQTPIQPEGYQIAAKYKPVLQEADVGGDFCDIFDLGDGRIGITIGDVTGKGLSAALRVSAARNAIRCYAFIDNRPSHVMSLVNDVLCRNIVTERDMLTAFFAVLDTGTGLLTYCNAGHEPPLVWHSKAAEYLTEGGPMFIGMGKQTYLEGAVRLDAGDTLVLMTDGITEACIDIRSEMFGASGIEHSLSRDAGLSAEQITDGIQKDAESFAGGRLRDDVTIVVIKKL